MGSKYLSNGTIIGGHYEIIDVLGEDDFEILYLVKNIRREGSFFVIKELFLEVFSERKGNIVETIPEALGVFNKRKAEIVNEINNLHRRHIECEIKVFAYFEENGTIYSCMAYTPNAKVEAYLQFEPKKDTKLPLLEELTKVDKEEKKKFPLWLIGLILVSLIGALAFNQYGDKLKTLNLWNSSNPTEVNSTQEKDDTIRKSEKVFQRHNVVELNKTRTQEKRGFFENNLSFMNVPKKESMLIEENRTKEKVDEKNITKKILNEVKISKEKVDENNLSKAVVNELNTTKKETKKEVSKSNQDKSNLPKIFSEAHIRQFLKKYVKTTAHSSSKRVMRLYDSKIKRYFQFRNITPKRVGKSVRTYNRKWKHRNFKLLKFKILKRYSKNGVNYCDIRTSTKWYVSDSHGKKRSGYSKGFMTIKDTKNGFKVKSIYGIN